MLWGFCLPNRYVLCRHFDGAFHAFSSMTGLIISGFRVNVLFLSTNKYNWKDIRHCILVKITWIKNSVQINVMDDIDLLNCRKRLVPYGGRWTMLLNLLLIRCYIFQEPAALIWFFFILSWWHGWFKKCRPNSSNVISTENVLNIHGKLLCIVSQGYGKFLVMLLP